MQMLRPDRFFLFVIRRSGSFGNFWAGWAYNSIDKLYSCHFILCVSQCPHSTIA